MMKKLHPWKCTRVIGLSVLQASCLPECLAFNKESPPRILAVGGHLDPKMAQDGAKLGPKWPKIAQDGPKMARDGPNQKDDHPTPEKKERKEKHLSAAPGPWGAPRAR